MLDWFGLGNRLNHLSKVPWDNDVMTTMSSSIGIGSLVKSQRGALVQVPKSAAYNCARSEAVDRNE